MAEKSENTQNNQEELLNDELAKEADRMIELWILRIKIGWGSVEKVPTIYKMPVYTALVERDILNILDIPEDYRERVINRLEPRV